MGSADTSLHAYALATQNLGKKQKEVLDTLRFFPDATNAEIAARLGWPINRVTPRMGELRTQGLVLEAGKRMCKMTGGTAHAWRAKHPVLPPAFEKEAQKPKVETSNQSLGI
jgi:hypothetical protein